MRGYRAQVSFWRRSPYLDPLRTSSESVQSDPELRRSWTACAWLPAPSPLGEGRRSRSLSSPTCAAVPRELGELSPPASIAVDVFAERNTNGDTPATRRTLLIRADRMFRADVQYPRVYQRGYEAF